MNNTKNLKNKYAELKQKLFDIKYAYLNEKQREAVYTNEGPLLILAGAGSGKTTVLVNRIAFLIKYGGAYFNGAGKDDGIEISESEIGTLETMLKYAEKSEPEDLDDILGQFAYKQCPAYAILSITFTNKAANEMKTRLANILGDAADDIWAGTFHSVCVKILRRYIDRLGYNSNFTIYDSDDVKRQLAAIMKEFNISDDNLPVRYVQTVISRSKDELIYPEEFVADSNNIKEKDTRRIYDEYQKRLKLSNAVDFDEDLKQPIICHHCGMCVRYCPHGCLSMQEVPD